MGHETSQESLQAPEGMPRRGFLKKGLLGGAVLALGATGLALRPGRELPLPAEGLRVLSAREYAVVEALVRRIAPVTTGFPDPTRDIPTALNVDRLLATSDSTVAKELKQLLGLFENALGGLLFGGRVTPFTRLEGAEQDRVLAEWRDSALAVRRTGYLALRTLVLGGYYGDRRAQLATGWPGQPAGLHDPSAQKWKGEGPRPQSNGSPPPGLYASNPQTKEER
ncbi:gluconate 2-dehydrogenase subunit 3 family protein [Aggregicoccus sp. 17bor-14]|uniref:gluconate 2-dehydrogenase subunit 3 family protein n=1 Tax=Myxococcaceae TaxID=31 RepID=UPI00129CE5F9|nr:MULTISPECIES: gluconate 2-dehydrogenase subunit 3 family protein [Myxococcaceae]MBF5044608.1 gluconate 2-dehydrogenase subunit 3 family protein [Simulacricoccus sp. 17bor-14]MRI90352.1 gluconate 2-dehydrogenase subunit 3 family protein [Aggregicoccus sp. 17bor-14]